MTSTLTLPSRAVIREVRLRDGLQSIQTILSTARKKAWLHDAHAAGQSEIEVGSFVPPNCCRRWQTRLTCWLTPKPCQALLPRC